MVVVDSLHTTLSALNQGTSPARAKATEFASWIDPKSKKPVTTMKLRGLQRSALGSFQATDALMMEALWNNREQIIKALDSAL